MHDWFSTRYDLEILGFEAGSEHIADARAELADVEGVQLDHVALVGPDHVGDEVELYLSGGQSRGKGDSLFSTRGQRSETVPARRLSKVLADRGCSSDTMPVILRMNIEGAEQFVIQDLLDTGLTASIDGYYGCGTTCRRSTRRRTSASADCSGPTASPTSHSTIGICHIVCAGSPYGPTSRPRSAGD
jgi:hypothetical protein